MFVAMPVGGFKYTADQPKQFSRSDLDRAVTREFCAECGTHGPFVSDEEVEKVVRHLKTQGQPEYLEAVTAEEPTDEDGAVFDSTGMGGDGGGDLFSQAVAIVKRDRKASTSYIQRRLQIGYNRAASLMERMELEGIVGQANHAGKREILVAEEEGGF